MGYFISLIIGFCLGMLAAALLRANDENNNK